MVVKESGEKSAMFPKTHYGGHFDHTYRKPYRATVDSEDRIGRQMCYVEGQKVPCSSMDSRRMKKIKELRAKYGPR